MTKSHTADADTKLTRSLLSCFSAADDGSIAPMAALSMTALVGGMALSAEAGVWYSQQRDLQAIADAAAFGSAFYLDGPNSHSTVENEARRLVSANGLASTPSNTSVTFPEADKIKVALTDESDRLLSSLFSKGKVSIGADATAQITKGTVETCIVALNELDVGLTASGQAQLDLRGCSLTSNTSAFKKDGVTLSGQATINAECIYVVNDADITATSNVACAPVQKYQKIDQPVADPYADKVFDPVAYCQGKPYVDLPEYKGTITIQPGCYQNAISLSSDANVTFMPGVYVLFGTLSISGQAAASGDGVTLALAGGSDLNFSGQGVVRFTPPTAADAMLDPELEPFVGVVIYGESRDGVTAGSYNLSGGFNLQLEGAIYSKNSEVKVSGNAGFASDCLQIVASSLTISGTADMTTACEGRDYELAGVELGDPKVTLID